MIRVRLLGVLRSALGKPELALDCESIRVGELLRMVQSHAARGLQYSLSSSNTLVIVNAKEISALEGEETVVATGDEVVLIPVAHGG